MTQEASVCRFCLESKETPKNPLLQPCDCRGSIRLVHEVCLNHWRRIDPVRNSITCLLCFTPYRNLRDHYIELLPDETKFLVLFARYPILLFFVVNYIGVLHYSFLFAYYSRNSFFEMYQYVFQMVYFVLVAKLWNVNNKRAYWKRWQRPSTLFIFMCHLVSVYLIHVHEYIAIIPLNVSLTYYWHNHKQILLELNQR
jgi:hypothetical protein